MISFIFDRLLHKRASFWTAKEECNLLGGQLLLLAHAREVMTALGRSMVGNVQDSYRLVRGQVV